MANFLLDSKNVVFTLKPKHASPIEQIVPYASTTQWIEIPAGDCEILIHAGETAIIRKTIGLGKGAKYTLAISGILPIETETNAHTINKKLHDIFEGVTAEVPNGGLPQLQVFLEKFEGSKMQSHLKARHLSPLLSGIEIFIEDKGKFKSLAKLQYPQSSSTIKFTPGKRQIQIRPTESPMVLYEGTIQLNPSTLTSLYVIGQIDRYPADLQAVVLEN